MATKSASKAAPKKSTAKKAPAKKTTSVKKTTTKKPAAKPAVKREVVKQTEVNVYNTEVSVVLAMAAVAILMFIAYLIINSAL